MSVGRLLFPPARPTLVIGTGLWLLVAVAAVRTTADLDLWGHLRFGHDIVAAGHVVEWDSYSFTSDRPWVNHEWLSEVVFWRVYAAFGPAGLILLKLVVIAAFLAVVYWQLRQFHPAPRVLPLLLLLAFMGTFWRTGAIRPQLFSVLLFALLLSSIAEADRGRLTWLWLAPPVMAVWANIHGGWLVGAGTLAIWVLAGVLRPHADLRERFLVLAAGVGCLLATLVNPYGFGLWKFLGQTVRLDRADITEWSPITTFPFAVGFPWSVVLVAGIFALLRAGRPKRASYLAIIAMLAVASFRVSRLDAFFALSVVVLLGEPLVWTMSNPLPGSRPLLPRELDGKLVRVLAGLSIAGMVAVAVAFTVPAVRCMALPDTLPEPGSTQFIQGKKLAGRLVTSFNWGEYAIWFLAPSLKVSIDGRRETAYSDRLVTDHRNLFLGTPAGFAFLQQLAPDYLWIPNSYPLAHELGGAGWRPLFRGPVSTVFGPKGVSDSVQADGRKSVKGRCFPGP